MDSKNRIYEPLYSNSWVLVIGINDYKYASPLGYARNDAEVFAETLSEQFEFPSENVIKLLDAEATKENILDEFTKFTSDAVSGDDRIIIFFAAHGVTRFGSRGEIGFLVPHDGDIDNIGSLVPWDDFTRYSELIHAKHILFIMDTCYGGTAIQRYLPPGSMRFAKDMLSRYSRQVLTAGKADETVADSGGPRAGHSVFTGHLLDGLEGAAASTDGLLTANRIMAYVYDRVAKDYNSNQTPHFGFLDGDGDMILDLSPLASLDDDPETDKDILIEIPADTQPQVDDPAPPLLADKMKEYLSDPQSRIKLHDAVSAEIRSVLAKTDEQSFPIQGASATKEEIANRLRRYEEAVSDLVTVVVMVARWGDHGHRKTLEHVYTRLPDVHSASGGPVLFLGMRWYPLSFLMYVGGIAALAAEDFENLATILLARVRKGYSGEALQPVIIPTVEEMHDVSGTNAFKLLPGHDQHYVPRSEYMFKVVQPRIDDLLFLGRDYERLFDRLELMLALVFADLTFDSRGRVWGPIGRFGWKYSGRHSGENPFDDLVREADLQKDDWGPLRAGLFNGSSKRFAVIAGGYRELLGGLKWF